MRPTYIRLNLPNSIVINTSVVSISGNFGSFSERKQKIAKRDIYVCRSHPHTNSRSEGNFSCDLHPLLGVHVERASMLQMITPFQCALLYKVVKTFFIFLCETRFIFHINYLPMVIFEFQFLIHPFFNFGKYLTEENNDQFRSSKFDKRVSHKFYAKIIH